MSHVIGAFCVYVVLLVASMLPCGSLEMQDNTTCGIQPALQPGSRIINGDAAQSGEWPWQAALIFKDYIICGGSLIHPQWILTAAHCLQTVTEHPELFQFRMGTNNLLADSENMQQRRAVAMYMHPDYNIKTSNLSNDVALFKMELPFNITDYVRTVCLPQKDMTGFSNDTVVTVTGWGQTENGTANVEELLEVALFVQNQTSCAEIWSIAEQGLISIDNTMICAGRPGETPTKSACSGDSGGPLVLQFEDKWTQVGVVSFGPRDCSSIEIPNVYARVTTFLDWIEPIFNGSEPEGQTRECTDMEYRCSLGGCITRDSKCNGFYDCVDYNDEAYCDSLAILFDPYYNVRLNDTSVIDQIAVESAEECAKICIESGNYCYSFDVIGNHTHLTCAMAGADFQVIPTSPLVSGGQILDHDVVIHFELDPRVGGPTFNDSSHFGFVASPGVFDQEFSGSDVEPYIWSIKPSGGANIITFTFAGILADEFKGIHNGPNGSCSSYVVFQALDQDDNYLKTNRVCLYELETANVVTVEGWWFMLQFYTNNVTNNNFVASYKAEWRCNYTINVERAGLVSSPLYPDLAYPRYVNCTTLLIAPTGKQIAMEWETFSQSICELGHNVGIFDGYEPNLDKLITSCSTNASQQQQKIVSTMGALLVLFLSNANPNYPGEGFNIIYYIEKSRPSTEIPSTEKLSTEITSIPDVTEKDQLNQKLTVYKKALIGVSVGAGILLIVLIFYVMYLNDEKTNMESSQPKKGVYNSKKDNDYEMAADPGIDGNANEGFEAI